MSQAISLKELERKAWRSTFQDGIWDIYLGLLLLSMAASAWMTDRGLPESRSIPIYIGLEVVALIVLWAGKRFITVPRMGRVKFGPKRKGRLSWVRLILALSAGLGLAVFLVTPAARSPGEGWLNVRVLGPALWVVNCIVVFSLGAFLLDFRRLYLIGVLYAIAVPIDLLMSRLAGIDASYLAFGAPGLIVTAMGLVVLARFVRDYPLLVEGPASQGVPHGNS
jgi:hypothetical protein